MVQVKRWALTTLLLLAATLASAQESNIQGRSLAATCANCHGTNGAARGEIPSLAGRPAPELLGAMADFKSGARSATIMHQIAKGYTDEQLRLIAAHFAAQPRP